MKLSEALILRKDIQSRLDEMENRLCACALTQEGESPAEDPAALLAEAESLTQPAERAVRAHQPDQQPHHDRGTKPDRAAGAPRRAGTQAEPAVQPAQRASQAPRRASGREIRILPTVDIPALRKRLDASAKELRELDMRIQQINWTVDLQ